MSVSDRPPTVATLAAHAGSPDPRVVAARPAAPALEPAAAYEFDSIAACEAAVATGADFAYVRHGHPNGRALERAVAALEGAEDALATSSGMSAVAALVLAHASAGDAVAVQADAYGGTTALLGDDLARLGLRVLPVDVRVPGDVAAALGERPRLLLAESLSNPLLHAADVPALAAACRGAGALLAIDATFATPVFRRPLADGADLVLHSATKFLGGHHDLCAGVLAGQAALVAPARRIATRLGAHAAPFDAWLALRGLRTLDVRMRRAAETAGLLVARLRGHAAVTRVLHPGWGALVSFDVGSRAAADRLVAALDLVTLAPSLGGVTTSLSHPATTSHRTLPEGSRASLGISDGLLRLSVGLEDPDDVWHDLARGLGARP